MTTAEQLRASVSRATCEVSVAGVPWPAYKLYALVLGGVVALLVGLATMSAAAAVLSAASVATVVWVAFSAYCSSRR
jgi:hypothetical protein